MCSEQGFLGHFLDAAPGQGGNLLTFGDLELVVLLVPQAAALVVDDPDGKLRVRTVRSFQGEVSCCVGKKDGDKIKQNLPIKRIDAPWSTFRTSTHT